MTEKTPKRVLACGGRHLKDIDLVWDSLDLYNEDVGIEVLIHGGAEGADSHASAWAKSRGIPELPFPVSEEEWAILGLKAGPLRNTKMIVEGKPELVIAFPGGKGTANMIKQATAAGIPVVEIEGYE